MRVLIGVDGSAGSLAATEFVGRLLSANDEVVFCYSAPQIHLRTARPPEPEVLQRAAQSLSAAVFQEAIGRLPAEVRGGAETVLSDQDPRLSLPQIAQEQQAGLIVVGARGDRTDLALGSVARSVAHATSVPLLVVRPTGPSGKTGGLRVLLAYDGSPSSHRAADVVSRFTFPPGSSGQVMQVIEGMFVGQIPDWLEKQARSPETEAMARAWVEEHEAEKRAAAEALAQFEQRLPEPFHNQPPIVAEGYPSDQILATLKSGNFDLAVVGARGLGRIARLILGSTSETILTHAPCSVLIVRQDAP